VTLVPRLIVINSANGQQADPMLGGIDFNNAGGPGLAFGVVGS